MSVIEDFAKQLKNEVISLMNEKNINEVTLIDYNNTSRVTKIVSIVVKINRNWVALPVEKIILSEGNKIEFETTDDDETLINMGYGPFFNDKDPMTEHEFTMLFKDGIAEEVNIVNGVPEIKTDKDSIILEYPRQEDFTEKRLNEIKEFMGTVDCYHIALLYGNPKYRHMLKKC